MRNRLLALVGASVVLVGACAVIALELSASDDRAARGPNFLVIDIDVLSWDHIGVVRDGVSNTPNIDALARRGVRFTNAFSHSGWTLPALSSLLSGMLPSPARANWRSVPWFPASSHLMPEILGYYGYTTAAFFGYGVAGSSPFSARFQHVYVRTPPASGPIPDPPTEDVLTFLDRAPTPFFALVHDANMHHTYLYNREDVAEGFPPPTASEKDLLYSSVYAHLSATQGEAAAQEAIRRHYDRMVGYYDAAVGTILDRLEEDGLADDTVVVVTSDHGDDFFEHANVAHGLLYDSTIRVPLIVYDPRAQMSGQELSTVVQYTDLAPTLLERAGVPRAQDMVGQSLLPLLGLSAGAYTERPVYAMSSPCHAAWRAGGRKLVLRQQGDGDEWFPAGGLNQVHVTLPDFLQAQGLTDLVLPDCAMVGGGELGGRGSVLVEYYDLGADPGERRNLVDVAPQDAAALLPPLLRTLDERARAVAGTVGQPLSGAEVEALRRQGYWGLVDPTSASRHAPGEGAAP